MTAYSVTMDGACCVIRLPCESMCEALKDLSTVNDVIMNDCSAGHWNTKIKI